MISLAARMVLLAMPVAFGSVLPASAIVVDELEDGCGSTLCRAFSSLGLVPADATLAARVATNVHAWRIGGSTAIHVMAPDTASLALSDFAALGIRG